MSVTENVAFRFICGSIVLLPFLLKNWRPFRGHDLRMLLLAGIVGVPVQFLVQFKGLQLTTVSHASLIVATLPMLLALGSAVFLRERLTGMEWATLLLSALGAVLIALSNRPSASEPQTTTGGDILILISLLAAVVMTFATKRLVDRHDSLQVTAAMIIVGTVFLLVWAELWEPLRFHFSPRTWLAVSAQGVLATAGAYLFWNWGLARMPASRSGVFLNLEPVVGTLLGLFLLHERLGPMAILGGVMILGSAVYFTRRSAA
jgi:drug/metabolite transporter (DMT)-like permease